MIVLQSQINNCETKRDTMKKKFAFLPMGTHYDPQTDRASFETPKQVTYIYTVNTMDEALEKAAAITEDGVGAIELCGALASRRTQNNRGDRRQGSRGYVTHFPETGRAFEAFSRRRRSKTCLWERTQNRGLHLFGTVLY